MNPKVTALTLRLSKSKISGQTHQAASKLQQAPVEQQPICTGSVMEIPKYMGCEGFVGRVRMLRGFESLVITGQAKHQIYGNRLKSTLLHSSALWALNKAEDFNFFLLLSARRTKSQDRSLQMNPMTPSPLLWGWRHGRVGDFGLFHP